jgi:hypothetical protein
MYVVFVKQTLTLYLLLSQTLLELGKVQGLGQQPHI